jgi:hypothetical protein
MLTAQGKHATHLMLYGTKTENHIQQYRPGTEPTGMESIIMAQYNKKQGLRHFGEKGIEALMTELRQLDMRKVLAPISVSALSKEEKRMALNYLMFLSEKCTGVIKGRGCADG